MGIFSWLSVRSSCISTQALLQLVVGQLSRVSQQDSAQHLVLHTVWNDEPKNWLQVCFWVIVEYVKAPICSNVCWHALIPGCIPQIWVCTRDKTHKPFLFYMHLYIPSKAVTLRLNIHISCTQIPNGLSVSVRVKWSFFNFVCKQ